MDGDAPNQPESPWKFTSNAAPTPAASPSQEVPHDEQQPILEDDTVQWTASEYIAHHKTFGWYAGLGLATAVITALAYLIFHDTISAGVVVFVGVMLGIAAGRQPRVLPYRVDRRGITIGQKFYDYAAFKSFFIVDEGAFSSITLMPTGRFAPDLSIYYDPKDEHKIIGALGNHLPMEQNQMAAVDRLMRRIRF